MATDVNRFSWPAVGILLIGTLIRFINLDADPHYYDWVGYITDEGLWSQHARSLALHGILFDSSLVNLHLVLAPFFQLCNYLVFELLGVSLLTSRILIASCGSAILVVFWTLLRHTVSSHALVSGLILLAFQTDLVVLSRVAVPEMAVMLFQLIIYFAIVGSGRSSWRMVSAGILMLMACGMKATMVLFFLPIFSIVIVLMPNNSVAPRRRWRDLALFWGGFTLPTLIGGSIFYLLNSHQALNFISMGHSLITSGRFTGLSSQFLYNVMSFPFMHVLSPTFSLWLLGLWLAVLGWLVEDGDQGDLRWRRYFTTSVTWFLSYFFIMLSLDYFPTRYKVHVLIPLALIGTLGISRIQSLGLSRVIECYGETAKLSRVLWAAVVTVPTAAFVGPLLARVVALFASDVGRMRTNATCFIVIWLALSFVADRLRRNQKAVKVLLVFPLIAAAAWIIYSTVGPVTSFWPSGDTQYHTGAFFWAILIVLVLSLTLLTVFDQWKYPDGSRSISGFAIIYLSISLVGLAPGYLNPHFTIRDVSRHLGATLSGTTSIAAIRTESLFNDNKLRYQSIKTVNWSAEKPEILVVAFGFGRGLEGIRREYRPIMRYNLYVSPEYRPAGLNTSQRAPEGVVITVYAKNLPAQKPSQVFSFAQ